MHATHPCQRKDNFAFRLLKSTCTEKEQLPFLRLVLLQHHLLLQHILLFFQIFELFAQNNFPFLKGKDQTNQAG